MMAYRGKRLTPLGVKRDIRKMMNVFPKQQVRITRLLSDYTDTGARVNSREELYEGEALVRPGSGDTEGYGLGTVENLSLVILILGVHGFRQGDIVTINDGREYEVDFPPTYFEAFTELRLQQKSQLGQPTEPR